MPRLQPSRKIPMPNLLCVTYGRQQLFQLDTQIAAAMRDPLNEQLWDAAGQTRARVLRIPAVASLLSAWKISPEADLDRIQPVLHRRLHS